MPRLVRRRPLSERIFAALNPYDFLLWLSEEVETRDLGSKSVGTQAGLVLNFIFLLVRANTGSSRSGDDVFGDSSGSGWLSYLVWFLSWTMVVFSILNLGYTFWRSRSYRLFEADVEQTPGTPSAYRVRVEANPADSASPQQRLTNLLAAESAESRAHPDKTRDVWELALWDPLPASLQLVCLFSPLHVLIYMLSLPLAPLDPQPSVTVFKCLVEQVTLSGLLVAFVERFTQQNKDAAIIQKWVMREYDTKFVHPRLHPVVREVGVQCSIGDTENEDESVVVGTPATQISHGFQTHPNQNYAKHLGAGRVEQPRSPIPMSPRLFTPAPSSRQSDVFTSSRPSRPSGLRKSLPASTPELPVETPMQPTSTTTSSDNGTNFGGSLGVYTHARSPLKKATSMSDMNHSGPFLRETLEKWLL